MKISPLFLLTFIVASSCQREEVAPVVPRFSFTYQSFNEGSEAISRMNVSTATVYPEENETHLVGTGNSIWYEPYEENHLYPYDVIIVTPDSLVYPGCIVSMTVNVAHLVQNGEFEQERFMTYSKLDTVRSPTDSIMTVVWPRDSLQFTQL